MTLTQAAFWTKRFMVLGVIFIILSGLALIGYNLWQQYSKTHQRPQDQKPEAKFGALPKIKFPPTSLSPSNYSYSLDTPTGSLPEIPSIIKVYFIPRSGVSLQSFDKSAEMARRLGFPNGPEVLSSNQYKFTDTSGGQMTVDIDTGNFHFQRQVKGDPKRLDADAFANENKLLDKFKSYLSDKNFLPKELENGRSKIAFSGPSPAESDSADISIWPANIDDLPIVNSNAKNSLIRAKVTKYTEEVSRFSSVDYIFWLVDKTTASTYPLKSATQAYANLRDGQGFITLEPPKAQVSLTSVYLAYFEPEEYSPYLQPVFVFEGPEFQALVPAVNQN